MAALQASPGPILCHAVRLKPGEDLRNSLLQFVQERNIKSAFILTCCGSLTKATIRHAFDPTLGHSQERVKTYDEYFEILSLVGTVSGGHGHLHISLGDKKGRVIGGHVIGDMPIFTTAEIVIGEIPHVEFVRVPDPDSGYDELAFSEAKDS